MKKTIILFYFLFVVLTLNVQSQINKKEIASLPLYTITVYEEGIEWGDIVIELYPEIAPKMCRNFDSLVAIRFYDGTAFHRSVPSYVIQGGDPNSKDKPKDTWGNGDSSQVNIPAEFSSLKHEKGIVSTARDVDINSGNSQFFICMKSAPKLDGKYTIFGKVISGMELAEKINSVKCEKQTLFDEISSPIKKITMKIRKQK